MMCKIRIFTLQILQISSSIFYEIIFKRSVVVLNTIIARTLSQISSLGPRSNFMQFRKLSFQKLLNISRFGHKIQTKPQKNNLRQGSLHMSP